MTRTLGMHGGLRETRGQRELSPGKRALSSDPSFLPTKTGEVGKKRNDFFWSTAFTLFCHHAVQAQGASGCEPRCR